MHAQVLIKRAKRAERAGLGEGGSKGSAGTQWEVVRARGHLDEVLELQNAADYAASNQPKPDGSRGKGSRGRVASSPALAPHGGGAPGASSMAAQLVLVEEGLLGGGAFSRVTVAVEEGTGRQYALKRMRKSAVVNCPDHVYCEQSITRNLSHPFCIRQYGSFQVAWPAGV
jgi:cGMP-dependent protein kinase 2